MIAALFVETGGCYFGMPDVEPWDIFSNAKTYMGPWPVVAHPPCQRWGRYWHGSPRKPHQYLLGDDDGCFASALDSVRAWGGVLEHPAHSHAWRWFDLHKPRASGGWTLADDYGWTCQVEQGHYGHFSAKKTWLYAVGTKRPELKWGPSNVPLNPEMLAKYGYEKARRCGNIGWVGGGHKQKIRASTPIEFRDLLLSLVRICTCLENDCDCQKFPSHISMECPIHNNDPMPRDTCPIHGTSIEKNDC